MFLQMSGVIDGQICYFSFALSQNMINASDSYTKFVTKNKEENKIIPLFMFDNRTCHFQSVTSLQFTEEPLSAFLSSFYAALNNS